MAKFNVNVPRSVIPVEFQLEVLSYLVRDREVVSRYAPLVNEEDFEHPAHRAIYSLAKAYYLKFLKTPPRVVLEMELRKWLQENAQSEMVPPELFWKEVDKLYRVPASERDYMLGLLHNFILKAQIVRLGDEALKTAQEPELEMGGLIGEINGLLGAISGRVTEKMEYLLGEAPTRHRQDPAVSKISTGFQTLDSVLGGGLGKGELGIVLAPTGYGKSFMLVALGAAALRVRTKVFHLTLELSRKKVIARYESLLSKIVKGELWRHSPAVTRQLLRMRKLVNPADVLVVDYPSGSISVDEFRSVLTQVRVGQGFDPGLVVVDYADIFKPVSTYRMEGWEQLTRTYENLRSVAQEFELPVWTGSQAHQATIGAEVVGIADIAGSFGKARIADVVITICRTPSERGNNRGRIYVDKNRENKSDVMIPFREDFDISSFWEASTPASPLEDGEPEAK